MTGMMIADGREDETHEGAFCSTRIFTQQSERERERERERARKTETKRERERERERQREREGAGREREKEAHDGSSMREALISRPKARSACHGTMLLQRAPRLSAT